MSEAMTPCPGPWADVCDGNCACIEHGGPTLERIALQLDLRREPENVASSGQCVARRVRHLIDSCIAHRKRISELEAKLAARSRFDFPLYIFDTETGEVSLAPSEPSS